MAAPIENKGAREYCKQGSIHTVITHVQVNGRKYKITHCMNDTEYRSSDLEQKLNATNEKMTLLAQAYDLGGKTTKLSLSGDTLTRERASGLVSAPVKLSDKIDKTEHTLKSGDLDAIVEKKIKRQIVKEALKNRSDYQSADETGKKGQVDQAVADIAWALHIQGELGKKEWKEKATQLKASIQERNTVIQRIKGLPFYQESKRTAAFPHPATPPLQPPRHGIEADVIIADSDSGLENPPASEEDREFESEFLPPEQSEELPVYGNVIRHEPVITDEIYTEEINSGQWPNLSINEQLRLWEYYDDHRENGLPPPPSISDELAQERLRRSNAIDEDSLYENHSESAADSSSPLPAQSETIDQEPNPEPSDGELQEQLNALREFSPSPSEDVNPLETAETGRSSSNYNNELLAREIQELPEQLKQEFENLIQPIKDQTDNRDPNIDIASPAFIREIKTNVAQFLISLGLQRTEEHPFSEIQKYCQSLLSTLGSGMTF